MGSIPILATKKEGALLIDTGLVFIIKVLLADSYPPEADKGSIPILATQFLG